MLDALPSVAAPPGPSLLSDLWLEDVYLVNWTPSILPLKSSSSQLQRKHSLFSLSNHSRLFLRGRNKQAIWLFCLEAATLVYKYLTPLQNELLWIRNWISLTKLKGEVGKKTLREAPGWGWI